MVWIDFFHQYNEGVLLINTYLYSTLKFHEAGSAIEFIIVLNCIYWMEYVINSMYITYSSNLIAGISL